MFLNRSVEIWFKLNSFTVLILRVVIVKSMLFELFYERNTPNFIYKIVQKKNKWNK